MNCHYCQRLLSCSFGIGFSESVSETKWNTVSSLPSVHDVINEIIQKNCFIRMIGFRKWMASDYESFGRCIRNFSLFFFQLNSTVEYPVKWRRIIIIWPHLSQNFQIFSSEYSMISIIRQIIIFSFSFLNK